MYNPKAEDLDNLLRLASVYPGVIVDNSASPAFDNAQVGLMNYLHNGKNLGIAEAQNIALNLLLQKASCDYVVFLDQDSRVSISYPADIVAEFKRIARSGLKLGIVGPTLHNRHIDRRYRSVLHKEIVNEDSYIEKREIISSGSCTVPKVLKEVGLNDAALFIDYVDFEWCWKATSHGYSCVVTPHVVMEHSVGQRTLTIGGHLIIVSSPIRYFYQLRNYLWLARRSYVPLSWKINIGAKSFLQWLYFPFLVKGGVTCWKYMTKGIITGLISKSKSYGQ